MKRLMTVWGMMIFSLWSLSAQSDVFFVQNPETARWSYRVTDAAGQLVSHTFYSVHEMQGDAVNGSVKLKVETIRPQAPSDTSSSLIFYRFQNGEFMVDMQALFSEEMLRSITETAMEQENISATEEEKQQAIEEMKSRFKITGEVRGIPRYPKVGSLPDYEFRFKFMVFNMRIEGEDRKITGREVIHTPAGDFDCFVMEETVTMKAMMQKEVEKTVSWYAYGIGLVKEASYDNKGNLQSVTLLDSLD